MGWIYRSFRGIASIIGAYVSYKQSKEAIKAKKATEAAQDRIFQNIQFGDFALFQKECERFCRLLQQASVGKDAQGKKENYVENELETFLTKFNGIISNSTGDIRIELEGKYELLKQMRNLVETKDIGSILKLLDEARELSRCIADVQMKNKLNV